MRRAWLAVIGAVCFTVALSGCDRVASIVPGLSDSASTPSVVHESPVIQIGVPEEDLEFELSPSEDPNFSEVQEAQYVYEGGYAYLVDPATSEVIDTPLDPVSKEPAVLPPEVSATPEVVEEFVQTPTREEPTDVNKYPNTGIFLEDD